MLERIALEPPLVAPRSRFTEDDVLGQDKAAMRENPLQGVVAIVTGASGGIGTAVARALAARGARLMLHGRNEQRLNALRDELTSVGAQAAVVVADLNEPATAGTLVRETVAAYGALDALVSCAGGARFTAFRKLGHEELDAGLAVNLLAPIALTREALPYLVDNERSWIVFVNTIAAREPAPPRGAAYLPAKSGLIHFAETLFAELRDEGVSVSSILPDLTDTALVPDSLGYDRSSLIRPESVADSVVFVMSAGSDACISELHLRPQPSLRRLPR